MTTRDELQRHMNRAVLLSKELTNLCIAPVSGRSLNLQSSLVEATGAADFRWIASQLANHVLEHALDHLDVNLMYAQKNITTANGHPFKGLQFNPGMMTAVTVLRGGAVLLNAIQELDWDWNFGHVLVENDRVSYCKLPSKLNQMSSIFVLDAVANANTVLTLHKLAEKIQKDPSLQAVDFFSQRIVVVSLFAERKTIEVIADKFKGVKVVTADVLDQEVPSGLTKFSDLYFQT
jgi:uracil phosphoribosyltransferase